MRWLIACVCCLFSPFAAAQGPVYAELQIGAAGVQHSNLDFYPRFASVSAGWYLKPGIGIEIFADSGISSDRKSSFDLEVSDAYGIALRLESAPIRRVQGYFVLGAVNYSVHQQSVVATGTPSTVLDGDFSGARISLGLMERLERWKNVLVSVEYRHYNADDPLRVDALLLGLRVNTP